MLFILYLIQNFSCIFSSLFGLLRYKIQDIEKVSLHLPVSGHKLSNEKKELCSLCVNHIVLYHEILKNAVAVDFDGYAIFGVLG